MPAPPDLVEEDLAPWSGTLSSRFEIEDAIVSGGFGDLRAVRFDRCRLVRADFTGASLARVDLRGSELDPAGDVGALRGAIIDPVQLAALAGHLARAAGIRVEDGW